MVGVVKKSSDILPGLVRLGLNIGGGLVLGGDMYLVHCAGVVEVWGGLFVYLYKQRSPTHPQQHKINACQKPHFQIVRGPAYPSCRTPIRLTLNIPTDKS